MSASGCRISTGHREGWSSLALIYCHGLQCKQDEKKSLLYLRQATPCGRHEFWLLFRVSYQGCAVAFELCHVVAQASNLDSLILEPFL